MEAKPSKFLHLNPKEYVELNKKLSIKTKQNKDF